MKNADLPAHPTYELNGQNVLQDTSYGLTKREMFAMHAPECPRWFENEFIDKFNETEFVVSRVCLHSSVIDFNDLGDYPFVTRSLTSLGQMQLLKQWRYTYADLMLGEGE